MSTHFEARRENAKQEFISIIKEYMLPLFSVRGNLKCKVSPSQNSELISIKTERDGKNYIYFYPCLGTEERPSPFYCKIGTYSSMALKKPAIHILRELLNTTEYEYYGSFLTKRHYGKAGMRQTTYKSRALDLAFEIGMCQWLAPDTRDAITLHKIICRMIEWASRTYEGKNVPFGIAINFGETADKEAADYLHFLENDSSAVFTDGIFSGILLDKNGCVLSFLTRNSIPPTKNPEHDILIPYQFADIARHSVNKTVGVIVLTNGEILLIKDQAICFAKRGRKWVYFDWTRVYSALRPYFLGGDSTNEETIKKKIQSVYCTILDVSFAHTGGCLALIHPQRADEINKQNIVTDRFDLYTTGKTPDNMSAESKEKAEILSYLLRYKQQEMRSFFELEKPLRKEILSLDGATVVSLSGSFYCAGSIVALPGGSAGGGRTAAAKQLAKFGVGVKISEDGYVEAYGVPVSDDGSLAASNTASMVPLFQFK